MTSASSKYTARTARATRMRVLTTALSPHRYETRTALAARCAPSPVLCQAPKYVRRVRALDGGEAPPSMQVLTTAHCSPHRYAPSTGEKRHRRVIETDNTAGVNIAKVAFAQMASDRL